MSHFDRRTAEEIHTRPLLGAALTHQQEESWITETWGTYAVAAEERPHGKLLQLLINGQSWNNQHIQLIK